jgi:hypothetical protein
VQVLLAGHRLHRERPPISAVKSTSNTRVERHWREVNESITSAVKVVLMSMEDEGLIQAGSDGDPAHIFCITSVTIPVLNYRIKQLRAGGAGRRIPGSKGCIPEAVRLFNNDITALAEEYVPSTADAVELFEEAGGTLTEEGTSGIDPLDGYLALRKYREALFRHGAPSIENIVEDLNVGTGDLLKRSILYYIELTNMLMEYI